MIVAYCVGDWELGLSAPMSAGGVADREGIGDFSVVLFKSRLEARRRKRRLCEFPAIIDSGPEVEEDAEGVVALVGGLMYGLLF